MRGKKKEKLEKEREERASKNKSVGKGQFQNKTNRNVFEKC